MEPQTKNPFVHLAKAMPRDESMAFRIFSSLNQADEPLNNWGMDLEMPDWLGEVHNVFNGVRCFIFGTGPSLIDQLPLLRGLNNEHTFTCNRMRTWEELPFTPWLHAVTEPGPFMAWGRGVVPTHDFPEAQNRVGCCWFPINIPGWNWLPKAPDDLQVRWQGVFGMGDYLPPIPSAWASPLTISQLALWMGFTKIYILGCDTTQKGQAWDRGWVPNVTTDGLLEALPHDWKIIVEDDHVFIHVPRPDHEWETLWEAPGRDCDALCAAAKKALEG